MSILSVTNTHTGAISRSSFVSFLFPIPTLSLSLLQKLAHFTLKASSSLFLPSLHLSSLTPTFQSHHIYWYVLSCLSNHFYPEVIANFHPKTIRFSNLSFQTLLDSLPSPSQPIYLSTTAIITSPTTAQYSEPRAPFPATTSSLSAPSVSLHFHFSMLSLFFKISASKGCVRIRLDLLYTFSTPCLLDYTKWNFNYVSSLIYYWMVVKRYQF